MKGAIIGDIVGSVYEVFNVKNKDFDLFPYGSRYTDDTVLTVAIADSILSSTGYKEMLMSYGQAYPNAGYGGMFMKWLQGIIKGPYNSWGNGSAMRVSPIGMVFDEESQVLEEARRSAIVTHNHPEGIKGAQAIAMCVFLARNGSTKQDIKDYTTTTFGYDLNSTVDEIRPDYEFDVSCQGSVPEAIISFLDSTSFEDAVRNAVSIGGDSDTIASMSGAIAEAYYKSIPMELESRMKDYIPIAFMDVIDSFYERCGW